MQTLPQYIKANFSNYIEELKEFLKIPSISTTSENKSDMRRAANFVADKLKAAGLNKTEVYSTEGYPIVYGEWLGAPGKPTILIYGHYDVQPADPIELWKSNPFKPEIRDGKIYARGATDDKGQLYIHIKSVEAFFKVKGSLPLNVKFLIEGEEEIGSPSLNTFIKQNKEILKCDTILISDTALYAPGIPTITYGLRGLSYLEVEITGPNRELHSGDYGGAVGNPVNVLAEMIAKLHDKNYKINIPHFYDDVLKLTKAERDNFKRLKFSDRAFAKEIGLKELYGEKGFSTLERLWARPTLDCNGVYGGYTGKGAKTVIASNAVAKISLRIVPNQNPIKIARLVTKHIKSITPKCMKVKVTNLQGAYPVITPLKHKATIAASKAMSQAFGKKTVYMREGASIPIVATFASVLKSPSVLMGFGLNTENLHSPNEHFSLRHFQLGIISSAKFIEEYSK
jgi:acetylornithine deacetylase/succinyl-diaminopimelate desuccinylase-like protein